MKISSRAMRHTVSVDLVPRQETDAFLDLGTNNTVVSMPIFGMKLFFFFSPFGASIQYIYSIYITYKYINYLFNIYERIKHKVLTSLGS